MPLRARPASFSARIAGFPFTTNGGDNSVSSFSVDKDGRLTLLDMKPTGNAVAGKSGTTKSLADLPSKGMLFVLHSFGPDHLRLLSVDDEGNLKPCEERLREIRKTSPTVCRSWLDSRPTGSS